LSKRKKKQGEERASLKLDDDPLFSEWASATPAQDVPQTYGNAAPSVAPYELGFEEEEDPFAQFAQVPPERRERLQRYVMATVAGCVAVCLAAMVRVGVARVTASNDDMPVVAAMPHDAPPPPLAVVAAKEPERVVAASDIPAPTPMAEEPAAERTEIEPAPSSVAVSTNGSAVGAPVSSPTAAATTALAASVSPVVAPLAAPPVAAPAPTPAPAAEPSPALAAAPTSLAPAKSVASVGAKTAPANSPPPLTTSTKGSAKSASEEREVARKALEHGRLRDAAAAAERAAALDPGDAEAWLILGAARQELGQGAAAHAAFKSCVQSGKRGPVGECRAMLR